MIPKIIHYCWLSGGKMPEAAQKCIATWHKVMPEYKLVLWDTKRFNINSVSFVKDAYKAGKYAFACDYIRLYAVYNEGGIYLDTDVYVLKSFNDLLEYDYFTSLERDLTTVPPDSPYYKAFKQNENPDFINKDIIRYEGFGLQAAVFGSVAAQPFVKDCMDWYKNNSYFFPDGLPIEKKLVSPDIYAAIAQKYGFKYISGLQRLQNNMVVLPADYFPNNIYKTDNAYAVHLCDNSWKDKPKYSKFYIGEKIRQNNILRRLLGKKKYYNWEERIKLGGDCKLHN